MIVVLQVIAKQHENTRLLGLGDEATVALPQIGLVTHVALPLTLTLTLTLTLILTPTLTLGSA